MAIKFLVSHDNGCATFTNLLAAVYFAEEVGSIVYIETEDGMAQISNFKTWAQLKA